MFRENADDAVDLYEHFDRLWIGLLQHQIPESLVVQMGKWKVEINGGI